jgi:hypothetical protein
MLRGVLDALQPEHIGDDTVQSGGEVRQQLLLGEI